MGVFDNPDIEVTPERVAELLRSDETVQLVDIREPYEWDAGRIAQAAHIELERLAAHAGEIDRERPVVFQCRLGARSAMAAQAFRAAGYDAFTMTGGIARWVREGLPIEPDDGFVADH